MTVETPRSQLQAELLPVVWLGRLRRSRVRPFLVLAVDAVLTCASLLLALLLHFGGRLPEEWRQDLGALLALLVACRLVSGFLLRIQRWSFLLSGLDDGVRIVLAGLLGTGLFVLGASVTPLPAPPGSVVVLELLLTVALLSALRFGPRLAWTHQADRRRAHRGRLIRALIVGAGATGEMLARDLRRSHEHDYQVVGFVDDDPAKRGSIVGGRPVLGTGQDLPALIERHAIRAVLLAVPRLSGREVRDLLHRCAALDVRFKVLPLQQAPRRGKPSDLRLDDLSPEDLLPRKMVEFDHHSACSGRRALVTGAAGSIGSETCTQLLERGIRQLVMVDVNENALYLQYRRLERRFEGVEIRAELADVREPGRLGSLFDRYHPQDVFHAAARKHVPFAEEAPCEAILHNVLGTRTAIRAALAAQVERFVFVSTDKAVRPSSVMGVTKRVGELMVTHAGRVSKTAFCAVRFGNVLGSAGSAVPLFQEQIAAGGPVTITHPEVRRYFMTIGEAVGLILEAAYGGYGELCVLDMGEQLSIVELARHMITMAGYVPEIDIPIVYTGLRPGEKLSEDLFTEREEQTHRVSKKLLVATPAPPPFELESTIERLIAAAEAGDEDRSVELLAALVPSFRRRPDMSTTPDRAETEAAVGAGSSAVGLVEGGHA